MSTPRSFHSSTAIRGSIPSQKSTSHMVPYRGLLKRAYAYLLEYDDQVQSYEPQPLSISYHAGKRVTRYTPDFLVVWKHQRPRLVACMPQTTAAQRASLMGLTAAQLWCQQHDHDFALITDATLRPHHVLLSNLEFLAPHSSVPIPPYTYDYLLKTIISIGGPFSSLELVQRTPLLPPTQTKSSLCNLVYHGELLADLTHPFQFASTPLLWKGDGDGLGTSPPSTTSSFRRIRGDAVDSSRHSAASSFSLPRAAHISRS